MILLWKIPIKNVENIKTHVFFHVPISSFYEVFGMLNSRIKNYFGKIEEKEGKEFLIGYK
jgi:hypothetical protein